MSDTKYCYPDTDVLINKLDIKDPFHEVQVQYFV